MGDQLPPGLTVMGYEPDGPSFEQSERAQWFRPPPIPPPDWETEARERAQLERSDGTSSA
jgi:hypothetical protein